MNSSEEGGKVIPFPSKFKNEGERTEEKRGTEINESEIRDVRGYLRRGEPKLVSDISDNMPILGILEQEKTGKIYFQSTPFYNVPRDASLGVMSPGTFELARKILKKPIEKILSSKEDTAVVVTYFMALSETADKYDSHIQNDIKEKDEADMAEFHRYLAEKIDFLEEKGLNFFIRGGYFSFNEHDSLPRHHLRAGHLYDVLALGEGDKIKEKEYIRKARKEYEEAIRVFTKLKQLAEEDYEKRVDRSSLARPDFKTSENTKFQTTLRGYDYQIGSINSALDRLKKME